MRRENRGEGRRRKGKLIERGESKEEDPGKKKIGLGRV